MKNLESIIIGLILIAIGVIIGLNTLNITDINIFFDGWWTLFIIIPSIISLLKFKSVASSLTWLTIGVVLLLCCQGILSFDLALELLLPIILIAMGLSFIFKKSTRNITNLLSLLILLIISFLSLGVSSNLTSP